MGYRVISRYNDGLVVMKDFPTRPGAEQEAKRRRAGFETDEGGFREPAASVAIEDGVAGVSVGPVGEIQLWNADGGRVDLNNALLPPDEYVEAACEVMHDAYEKAAVGAGWETQAASRKPWADVPEANKETMRAAVTALLAWVCVTPVGMP